MGEIDKEILETLRGIQKYLTGPVKTAECGLTVGQWLDIWYSKYKAGRLKESTKRSYVIDIEYHIKPVLGDTPLCLLDYTTIQNFLDAIPRSNTRLKVGTLLNSALKKAVALEKIPRNPYSAVELFRGQSRHYKPLQFAQQNAVLQSIRRKEMRAVAMFIMCVGCRIGEFLALDFDKDIDAVNRKIIISDNVDIKTGRRVGTKTKSGVRRVPYHEILVPYIETLREYVHGGGRFTYNKIRLYFARLYKRLGMEGYNLHSLRHTFISTGYYVGIREKYLQEFAGHSKFETTINIYTIRLDKGISPVSVYLDNLRDSIQV